MAGIVIAAISVIISFTGPPYSPWRAPTVIGIDVLIIWALASYLAARRDEHTASKDARTDDVCQERVSWLHRYQSANRSSVTQSSTDQSWY